MSESKVAGKNLVEDTIENATIGNNGTIGVSGGGTTMYDMHIARVLQGVTYTIKSDEAQSVSQQFVGGFFYSKPTLNSISYNGARLANTPATFTSPITGYVAFRTSHNYSIAQCEFGSTSTTYEPYCGYEISLGNDELRGTFKLVSNEIIADGDVKESNGEITRNYGIVDLGTLTFTKASSNSRFYVQLSDIKVSANNTPANMICAIYRTVSWDDNVSGIEKTIGASTGYISIMDSTYTDATDFKTAMDGVYLVYEKTTPTTETSTPKFEKILAHSIPIAPEPTIRTFCGS